MKNPSQAKSKRPSPGQNGQQPPSALVVRREIKKMSSTARLLKDVAAEEEKESRTTIRVVLPRTLRAALAARAAAKGISLNELCERATRRFCEQSNDESSSRPRPFKVGLTVPGVLAGLAFDETAILRFLMETIHLSEEHIDGAVREWIAVGRAAGRSPGEGIASLVVWHEVAFLANEFSSGKEEFRLGLGLFASPFDGIAMDHNFCERSLIDLVCEFLHDHRESLSRLVRKENKAGRPRLDLAEALAVAEQVLHDNKVVTEMDEVAGDYSHPTRLQLQMWETRLASIAVRYTPNALVA